MSLSLFCFCISLPPTLFHTLFPSFHVTLLLSIPYSVLSILPVSSSLQSREWGISKEVEFSPDPRMFQIRVTLFACLGGVT
jgi:hypothetical protein